MDYPKDYRAFLKAEGWEKLPPSDQSQGVARPESEKPVPEGAKLIDLVPPEDFKVGNMALREVIAQRRSRRRFTGDPLSLEELSFLLWSTQGVTKLHEAADGPVTMRVVPSGGCRHSFESYIVVNRVDGVAPGLYRYLPIEHKLVLIREEDGLARKVALACCGQAFIRQAAAVFIWTTIPYRMEWRYTVVAHKVIAIDAGHLCQNLYLAAESINAGTCAVGAYLQDKVDEIIGVDGENEFTIYIAPVGKVE